MHDWRHQMMLHLMLRLSGTATVRTTVNLDDALLEKARQLSGITERASLLHEALRALIARESARRLARLGGTEPGVKSVPRRRAVDK
jgi:Arc/MetJ family transcription regulator